MTHILAQGIMAKKRDGEVLSEDEIRDFEKGLTDAELGVWADAMLHSGEVVDLSEIQAPCADRHSTGAQIMEPPRSPDERVLRVLMSSWVAIDDSRTARR